MRVLDRYIVAAIGRSIALALAVLVVLLGLFLYVNEQGWVGVGRYGNVQALRYVLLNLPAAALQFLPVAVLLGALLALGQLARGSELTVMRAAGMSIARLCGSVLLVALLLLPAALLAGEWLAPPLTQLARVTKAVERDGGISLARGGGAWLRDGGRILRADGMAGGAGGVLAFELDGSTQLAAVGRAERVRVLPGGDWEFAGYASSRFTAAGVAADASVTQRLESSATTGFLAAVSSSPRELSLRALVHAIRHLAANGQDARPWRFAFWSGVARLAAIPLMLLLAVPFQFGRLRGAEQGARVVLGAALGLAWYIAQRMVESGALAFDLDPMLLALLPLLLLAGAVAMLLSRTGRLNAA
jgi:lipopolysaccharide export system permease protein